MTPSHVAEWLDLLADQRQLVEKERGTLSLVWTGPELPGSASRDTLIVTQELFRSAELHVLMTTYALYNAREIFASLAARMDEVPGLHVQLFTNIARGQGESKEVALRRHADDLAAYHWPWARRPEVYYDPRSIEDGAGAVLHAKCVVIDNRRALITSANFTEAAGERNIEVGVLTDAPTLVRELASQFRRLVEAGLLVRLPGW
ncbi:MAG: phospholipase [Myxococcales bacterium]|nr:phospholipase [Myxococcales bacterium]